ncbi:YLP motif-containing protein 1-like isoform X1 [Oncorhynchus clarkii lewisi]|uniref:YLP motif-containing protein 1-like isoform X1 n=1 Tax=Oncorhynchus clarkii lewisi TaxID=490388 RepID=UPI0039B8C829
MYPWGTNYGGGHQPPSQQNFGAPSPQGEGFAGGFGSYGAATPAAAPGSTFNSLREQHLQQMQQLQQLHQKQLQSVLHHDRNVDANPYGGGGTAAESWQGSSGYGYGSTGAGAPSPYQDEYQTMQAGPPGPQQPPLPPQSPQSKEAQPPPPDSTLPVPTQNNGTPATKEVNTKESLASKDQAHSSGSEEEKPDFTSMSLQEQQQYWYKQHLQNLQRLKAEKAKQGQGDGQTPRPHSTAAPPPPSEPPKSAPPPPPPKEEPPPPPPPEDKTPAPLAQDPAEAARLKQLQSAAAQWQQAQQQRAGYQYQALMRHHAQLQVILNQYQQCIQQPAQLETMSMAMQLSHYEKQQQQFGPVFGDWGRTFSQWQEQFQSYPHKDQLQDYELQWKQWQEQMNSTSAHLQERVTTLRATQQQYGGGSGQYGGSGGSDGGGQYGADQYGSSDRYGSGGYGDQYNQYGQYPQSGPDSQIQQGHMVSPSVPSQPGSQPSSTSGSMLQGPRPGQQGPSNAQRMGTPAGKPHQGPQAEQYNLSGTPGRGAGPGGRGAGPGGRGAGPGGRGVARSPVPPPGQPPPFQSPRGPRFDGPRGNGPLFDQQQQSGQQQRFNAPPGPRFNEQRQRFNQPGPRGPGPRFGQQGSRFDQPPTRQNPPGCFERPPDPLVPHIGPQPKPDTSKDTQPPQGKTETPAGSKPPGNKPTGPGKPGAEPEDMSEDMVDSLDGFFVQNDPIPQTKAEADAAAAASKGSTVNMEKVSPTGPAGTKPQVSTDASVSPKTASPTKTAFKPGGPDGPLKNNVNNNNRPQGPEPSKTDPMTNQPPGPPGPMGRGQPLGPVRGRGEADGGMRGGRGRGEFDGGMRRGRGRGEFDGGMRGGRGRGEFDGGMRGGRGRGELDGGMRGRGGRGGLRGRGGQQPGIPDFSPNTVPLGGGRTEDDMEGVPYDYRPPHEEMRSQHGGPEEDWQQDPSLEKPGGPPLPEEEMWVPEEHYYSPEDYYEDPGRGGPPMGRGEPLDGHHWEETDPPPPEYWGEEGDPYWMDRRPPPHGMRGGPRAPFHPGRSRPPRGRPGFMHQGGPRRPLPPPRGAMDPHDPLGSPMGPHDDMDPLGPPLHRDYNPRGPPMHHDMMERDMRGRPPPPREMMDRDLMGPGDHPPYHDTDRDLGWPPGPGRPPNHGRVGPRGPPPLEMMMERGGMRRRPMGPRGAPMGRARGMMQQPHEEMEGYPHDGYGEEFGGPDDDRYGRPLPPRDWPKRPPHDYDRGEEYYPHEPPRGGEWDRERGGPLPERDYPPPDRFREDEWTDERDQDRPPYAYEGDRDRPPYAYEGEEHGRGGKLQSRGYPDDPPYRHDEPPYLPPPEWERSRPPLPERNYPSDFEEHRPHYDGRAEPPRSDLGIPPSTSSQALAPPTTGPDSSQEPASQGTGPGILALSQRQHEIILKAAHELKLIRSVSLVLNREMQENLTEGEALSITSDPKTELPAGLLGLEIPPEVRSALQATNLISNSTAAKTVTWGDANPQDTGYMSSIPPVPNAPVIPKTVDYGHGHDLGAATVERISYGERIVLRPDPLPDRERSYEKELLGPLRDPYHRDLYYDRRPVDPYMERREYSRERDMYREKAPMDFERERYERERYPPRDDSKHSMDVDDRQPPGHPRPGPPPPRPGYRDRDMREREGSRTSRDREDTYGRPGGYDRPPFERGPERGPERYDHSDERGPERYNHGASAYGERRSYPEERGGGGGPTSSHPPPPPPTAPPSRMEKKPETKNVEDLLKLPGRDTRPERIVIIMRGLPGSGKSHVAKLIRDKEVECGGAPPRVLGLDDYFMTEVEKVEKDPETGKRIKLKCLEYEYEAEMEDTYRNSMLKTFRKTLDDGFFPFLIIDAINDRVKYFDQFWSAAKTKGFEVYLAEITADNQTCAKRNAHGRKMDDIQKMSSNWESSPRHMVRLDVRSLLQDAAIEEVEMEDLNPDDEPLKEPKKEEEEEDIKGYIPQSKWEMDTSDAKLDKLDGLVMGGKRKREGDDVAGMDDFLQLPDDYATRHSEPGKKRVRWADLEEQKDAERKRDIGFVVGQTDWEKITDQSGQIAQRALNRTKYF